MLYFLSTPKRDTPIVLKKFGEGQKLDWKSFTLLTSTAENAQELGVAIGFQYKPKSGGDFDHSNLITVLDKDGKMIHQQDIGASAEKVIHILEKN